MMKIAYDRPDGGVSIVTRLNGDWSLSGRDIPADATNVRLIEDVDVPADRTFRNAWTSAGNAIAHDMGKCRFLHREKLRAMRKPKLAALDVEYIRADEAGDTLAKQEIAVKKQALRDVTADPRIDAAKTTDELKVVIPEALL